MPLGREEGHSSTDKMQVKEVFIDFDHDDGYNSKIFHHGKNSIEIPALKTTSRPPQDYLDISIDDEPPPSPCSSTTLSLFSTTSEEFFVATPEPTFISFQTHREHMSHPVKKTYHQPPVKMRSYKPSEEDFVNTVNRQNNYSHNKIPERQHVSTLGSVVLGYRDKPSNADFVSADNSKTTNVASSTKTSALAGPKLQPEYVRKTQQVAKKCVLEQRGFDESSTNVGTSHSYSDSAYNKHASDSVRPTVSTLPLAYRKPSAKDFVTSTAAPHRSTLPPDFVNLAPDKVTDKPISSRQPDLDVMLSGAVRSSAFKKSDFIPVAVQPNDNLRRAKSKSLSDLSKKETKMKRFWDRKKVVQMNKDDQERCSHTEVTPSSMMTLAMELLVSKDNKAAKMFSEARRRADAASGEENSILPSLWVVPKSSNSYTVGKTASHLQPVLKSSSPTSTRKENLNNESKHENMTKSTAVVLKPPGTFLTKITSSSTKRAPESNKRVSSNVVLRQKKNTSKVHPHPKSMRERTRSEEVIPRERIRSEDVQRDLLTLTVADLVGSPDTIYTDTESEYDDKDYQVLSSSQKNVHPKDNPNKNKNSEINKTSVRNTTASETSKQHSTNFGGYDEVIHKENVNVKNRNLESHLDCSSDTNSALNDTSQIITKCVIEKPTVCQTQSTQTCNTISDTKQVQHSEELLPKYSGLMQPATVKRKIASKQINNNNNSTNYDKVAIQTCEIPIAKTDVMAKKESSQQQVGRQASVEDDCVESRPHRSSRSSSISNSSSLTTVSSLALSSSSSIGSPEQIMKDISKVQPELNSRFADFENESEIVDLRVHSPINESKKDECLQSNVETTNSVCQTIKESSEISSNDWGTSVPKPPPRSNSHVAMIKLQRKKYMEQNKAQATKISAGSLATEFNSQRMPQSVEEEKIFPREIDTCLYSNEEKEIKQDKSSVAMDSSKYAIANKAWPQNSKQIITSCKQTLACLASDKSTSKERRAIYFNEKPQLSSFQVDTPGIAGEHSPLVSKVIPDGYCIKPRENSNEQNDDDDKQIPIHARYLQSENSLPLNKPVYAGCGTSEDIEDMTEKTFRNGEISVVDGYKVNLVHPHNLRQHGDVRQCGDNNQNSSLFIADLVQQQSNQNAKKYDSNQEINQELVEENILLSTAYCPLSSQQEAAQGTGLEQTTTGIDAEFLRQSDPDTALSGYTSIPSSEQGIVRSKDTNVYFPDYRSVTAAETSPKKNKMSLSYNACPKPYTRSTSNCMFSSVKSKKLSTHRTQSLHNLHRSESPAQQSNITDDASKPQINHINDLNQGELFADHQDFIEFDGTYTSYHAVPPQHATTTSKNSAIKLLTGGKNVYSSCVKITLNPDKMDENVREQRNEVVAKPSSGDGNLDFEGMETEMRNNKNENKGYKHNTARRRSFPMKNERDRKDKNVREVITPDMKVTDKPALPPKPVLPAHSAVDEGEDFAGVVDGPTKNVKEIRAMFKGPDYADYAKPRLPARKPNTPHTSTNLVTVESDDSEEDISQRDSKSPNRESTEVAQQILGLFKGALTLESDETDGQQQTNGHDDTITPAQNGHTHTDEPQISLKDKVASFNVGKSPVKEVEDTNNNDVKDDIIVEKKEQIPKENSPAPTEIITNPAPITNGHKKAGVTQEKVNADSYDESLDQFYDVLEELSSS